MAKNKVRFISKKHHYVSQWYQKNILRNSDIYFEYRKSNNILKKKTVKDGVKNQYVKPHLNTLTVTDKPLKDCSLQDLSNFHKDDRIEKYFGNREDSISCFAEEVIKVRMTIKDHMIKISWKPVRWREFRMLLYSFSNQTIYMEYEQRKNKRIRKFCKNHSLTFKDR